VAALVLAVSVIATIFVKDNMVKDYAAATMTRANGAEVDLDSLDLSVLTGAVSVTGIQVTDAKEPQNNQVAIEKVASDASIYNLLLGKLVMENVQVSNVRFDQKRATPGEIVQTEAEEEPAVSDPCDSGVETAGAGKLDTYFKDAKALKERLQKARKWLPKAKKKTRTRPQKAPQKYLDYLRARASVPASPRILARRILLDNVQIPSSLFDNSKVLLTNISDSTGTAGLPVTFEMKSYDTDAFVNITFDYSSNDQTPRVSGVFSGFDLSKLQSSLSSDSGLMFEAGAASGQFDGRVTDEAIDLTIEVVVSNMKAKAQGDGVLKLGSKTTSETLDVLKNLNTTIRVVGPITEPRLVFDVKGLRSEFKNALVKAGKDKLAGEMDKHIDEQIDKNLGDKAPDELKDALKKSKGLLDGLLGEKDKK
jgi:hypothetical protein